MHNDDLFKTALADIEMSADKMDNAAEEDNDFVPSNKYEELLKDALVSGKVIVRGALAQRLFQRSKNKEYDALTTNEEKAKFRMNFVKKEVDMIMRGRTKSEEFDDEDITNGSWESFDSIVTLEGGRHNDDNILAAKLWCASCIKMGGRWVRRDPWRKRLYLLYIKKAVKQVWRKKWCVKTTLKEKGGRDKETNAEQSNDNTWVKNGTDNTTAQQGGTSKNTTVGKAAGKQRRKKVGASDDDAHRDDDEGELEGDGKKARTPFQQAIASANKTKGKLKAAMSITDRYLEAFDPSDVVIKAASDVLKAAKDTVLNMNKGFSQDFCVLTLAALRRKYSEADIISSASRMVKEFDAPLKRLEYENGRFGQYLAMSAQIRE